MGSMKNSTKTHTCEKNFDLGKSVGEVKFYTLS